MAQEYKNVAVVGGGASGMICTYYLIKNGIMPTVFDFAEPLRTLLPTGGGRCNLAHAEYDFKELAKNYPRGEKFLYSVFSKFSTSDTLAMFEEIGVTTYTQDDNRIFPISNSAKDVREKILAKTRQANIVKEKVLKISQIDNEYIIKTTKAEYLFTHVIVAIGGRNFNLSGLEQHTIIPQKPSLVGLNCLINKDLSGVAVKDIYSKDLKISGDILFTHFGISGPLIYKISSIKARENFPYILNFDLYPNEFNLQEELNKNPHKDLKNILSKFLPLKLIKNLFQELCYKKGCKIDAKTRDFILDTIHNISIEITGTNRGEETVTAGGICLDEINSKTMESKIYHNLYFIGEVLDIDGFCGGFNLQNAWSTAFVAANDISNK